jgi:hypothetical protein
MVLLYYVYRDRIAIESLYLISAFATVRTAFTMITGGEDSNHVQVDKLDIDRVPLFVGLNYHALHHVYPESYYGSVVKCFDWAIGSAFSIRGKRFAVTGASGAFGSPMIDLLNENKALSVTGISYKKDWSYSDYSKLEDIFRNTDVLILAHGSKVVDAMKANCESFVEMIELFRRVKSETTLLVPPEVWAVGSEIEIHPAWGIRDLQIYSESKRAFMHHARKYYDASDFVYRHIVPSAFDSKMGGAIISGRTAAKYALFLIFRGFQFVPVTYTTFAWFHFLKFKFFVAKAK